MLLEQIKTPGLAHFSYVIGSDGNAAGIDPQLDSETYLEIAQNAGLKIRYIFETHRNEDFISGARALSDITGATVFHGPNPASPIDYAKTVRDGDVRQVGQLKLSVLETPGHTDDSISIAVYDDSYPEGAVAVFTGDALFVGDVGRTDFYPDRQQEVAGLLYDSLQKILDLGPQAILYPAHGAGSVCGSGMAAREFSTLGHEQANNPRLNLPSKDAFISAKTAEHHYKPPYFKLMERLNIEGGSKSSDPIRVPELSLDELKADQPDILLDVRPVEAFLSNHVAGSRLLPVGMIAAFGGWFLDASHRIGLIAESADNARKAVEHLNRIGFGKVIGYASNVLGMAAAGADTDFIPTADTDAVATRKASAPDHWNILDVRSVDEFKSGHIDGAKHAYVGEILQAPEDYLTENSLTIMCGSGARASLAASALKAAGQTKLDVYIGSFSAWVKAGKPTVSSDG